MTRQYARPAQDLLAKIGFDAIIARIESGEAQSEIAEATGVSVGAIWSWLHRDAERSARTRAAMEASAEAWTDRGLRYLVEAENDQVAIARARALEQHCARRAAIRNPRRYSERMQVVGDASSPVQVAVVYRASMPVRGESDAEDGS